MPRTVLITGANRGIGLALAHQCLRRDEQVIACCRDPYHAHALQQLTEVYPDTLQLHQLDVSREEEYVSLKAAIGEQPLDWVFANAGLYGPADQAFGHTDYHRWQEVMAVNTMAPLRLAETFFDNLKDSGSRTLVCISSVWGSITLNDRGGDYLYRSSKAALNAVVKSLACDLAGDGIRVLAVHPGWVKTDMGGSEAPLEARDCAATLLEMLAQQPIDSGCFVDYRGHPLPW